MVWKNTLQKIYFSDKCSIDNKKESELKKPYQIKGLSENKICMNEFIW